MNVLRLIAFLALTPTLLTSSGSRGADLYGIWYDDYSDTKLEIKNTRGGIKVKQHGKLFSRWSTYDYSRYGLYDDCSGNVIIVKNYDQIQWRKGGRYSITLSRYNDYQAYDEYNDGDYYTSGSRSYSGGYHKNYQRDRYCGHWYDNDRKIYLSIEAYGRNGFRARYDNRWTYYYPYDDHYRDRRGNRYYVNKGYLTWRSHNNRRRMRFKRR